MWSATFRELMRMHYRVEIGMHSYGPCLFPGHLPAGTRVGNYCSLAPGLVALRRNHPVDRISQHPFFFNAAAGLLDRDTIPALEENPLTIGHDVWIGLNVLIAPSCRSIGDSAVVASGAVVTTDVPAFAIVGGVPANLIRWRLTEELRAAWVESKWWLKPVNELTGLVDTFTRPFCSDYPPQFHSSSRREQIVFGSAQRSKYSVMRMCIMGTPMNCGNRGVLALGASLVNLCWRRSQGGEVVLLLGNRDNQPAPFRVGGDLRLVPVVHCRMSPRSHPRDHLLWILLMSVLYRLLPMASVRAAITRSTPWVKAVADADLVGDVRGGDSFSDIYGMKGFLLGFLMAWTVLLVKGTMVQFPQTYGPYKSALARWLARFLLRRSSVIIARDKQSRKVAQELVGPEKEVLLSPDVAFSLEPIQPERIELTPPLSGPVPPEVIGLNVNGLMYHGGFTRNNMFGLKMDYAKFLPELVIALLAEQPGELWLVPHTYASLGHVESDNEASEKLWTSLPAESRNRVRIVSAEYDQHEIKWIIGQCDFFVGSRMHSCIAALSQGVPCVGVAYSRKFSGVFESVGMEDWVVDGRANGKDEAVAQIVSLYRRRHGVRKELSRRAETARQELVEVFRVLMNQAVPVREVPPARHPEAQPVEL